MGTPMPRNGRCRAKNEPLVVRNSLPDLLEHLAKTLESSGSALLIDETVEVARKKGGENTSLENYRLDQVIFEYRLLREVDIQY